MLVYLPSGQVLIHAADSVLSDTLVSLNGSVYYWADIAPNSFVYYLEEANLLVNATRDGQAEAAAVSLCRYVGSPTECGVAASAPPPPPPLCADSSDSCGDLVAAGERPRGCPELVVILRQREKKSVLPGSSPCVFLCMENTLRIPSAFGL